MAEARFRPTSEVACDVAVIGAGPAGASAAYYLARRGRTVVMLERGDFPRDKACGDGLTRRSVDLLNDMGLEPSLRQFQRISGLSICIAGGGVHNRDYRAGSSARCSYGLTAPRRQLDDIICRQALAAGAALWQRSAVRSPIFDADRVVGIRVQRGDRMIELRTRFVVAADGGSSAFARMVGLRERDPWSNGWAVSSYFNGVDGLSDRFHVLMPLNDPDGGTRLAGYGWAFPLGGDRVNVGVGYFPSRVQDLAINLRRLFSHFIATLGHNDPRFRAMRALGRLRGGLLPCSLEPQRSAGMGVVLAGDAAGLVDPFTGEGIDAALESGRLAAEVLDEALSSSDPYAADLSCYGRSLEARFSERNRLGRRLIGTHGFMWHLLVESSVAERPLFARLRATLTDMAANEPVRDELPLYGRLLVGAQLQQVRTALKRLKDSPFPLLTSACVDLGDRNAPLLHSAMLLTAARFGGSDNPELISAAVAVELTHRAMLTHSDVMDGSPDGSSIDSGSVGWSNRYAVMAGDYLLIQAYSMIVALGSEITQAFSQVSFDACIGKLREIDTTRRHHRACQRCHLQTVDKKIAGLFALSCRLGAELAAVDGRTSRALVRYGRNFGMAYQLGKEVQEITVTGDPCSSPFAARLRDGMPSMPLILSLHGRYAAKLQGLLESRRADAATVASIIELLTADGSPCRALALARRYAVAAVGCLDDLPHCADRAALQQIADSAVTGAVHTDL